MRNQKIDPIPFTKEALEKFQKEFDRLKIEEAAILVRLQTAREMGDLSENGAYKYAKFELGNTRRELGRLGHLLRYGYIQEKSKDQRTVSFGSIVTLTDQADKKNFTYTIVSAHESDPAKLKISTDSPLGKVLLNKVEGQIVKFEVPSGVRKFLIEKIE